MKAHIYKNNIKLHNKYIKELSVGVGRGKRVEGNK